MSLHQIIILNFFALFVLSFLFVRSYVRNKRNYYVVFLFAFSFLPVVNIFQSGVFADSLFTEHVKLAMSFDKLLSERIYIPQWSSNACSGFGCPVFQYIYPLPYYFISFSHKLGASYILATKFVLSISFVLSGYFMYLFAKNEFGGKSGFVSGIFYVFAPYHLIAVHFRSAVGEVLSFVFLPLCFYFISKYISDRKVYLSIFGGLMYFFLILSHQVTALLTLPLLVFFIIYACKVKRADISVIYGITLYFVTAFLLSVYYLLPVLIESKYIQFSKLVSISFAPISSYISSPLNYWFGLMYQGLNGELYPQIGFFHLAIIIFGIYTANKFSKIIQILLFGILFLIVIYFVLMLPISIQLYKIIPLLNNIQFSWRFIIEIGFLIAFFAGITLKNASRQTIAFFCIGVVSLSLLNWSSRSYQPGVDDKRLENEKIYNEKPCDIEISTPVWVPTCSRWIGMNPKQILETVSNPVNITVLQNNTLEKVFLVNSSSDMLLRANIYYYPGWTVLVDNKEQQVSTVLSHKKGLIHFRTDSGLHKVEIEYRDTPVRFYSRVVSISTLAVVVIYLLSIYIKHLIYGYKK